MADIAARVHNHNWRIDPIVRSLLDTDFYKLLMCQSVRRNRPDVQVRFQVNNRTASVRLADLVDESQLREQLDHARTLRLTRGESTWLRKDLVSTARSELSVPVRHVIPSAPVAGGR